MKVSRAYVRWRGAAMLATFGALWMPAASAPASGSVVHEQGCTVVVAQPFVPTRRIDPLVPDGFTVREDSPGMTAVGPVMEHCEAVSVNGGPPRETTWVGFRVGLAEEPEGFEPEPPRLGDRLLHLDDYQLFFASDNPDIIGLFRDIGVTDRQAVYVRHLVFDLDRESGAFFFDAPAPTPSPFQIVAARVGCYRAEPLPLVCTGTDPLAGPVDVSVHHWGSGPHGVWNVVDPDGGPDRIPQLRLGAAFGHLRPEPGSEMAKIFCSTDVTFDDPFAGSVSFAPNDFTLAIWKGPERPVEQTPPIAECE